MPSQQKDPLHPSSLPLHRREFLIGSGLALICASKKAPAQIVRDHARPMATHGVSSGDPTTGGVVIWSRADRPSRMRVEWSTDSSFKTKSTILGTEALPRGDWTARASIVDAPPGRELFYRVYFDDLKSSVTSAPEVGRIRIPDVSMHRPYRFVWSGDVCGQGFGINPDIGGYRIFDSMARVRPDVFIHCGDVIYADARLVPVRTLSDGRTWRNVMTPEKSKVAETLAEFHGNYRYNLMDENLRRFNAQVPSIYLWDDHETKNNWWPGWRLRDARYRLRDGGLLARRARRAFFDYVPIARSPNAPGRIYRALHQGPLVDVFTLDGRSFRNANEATKRSRKIGVSFFGDAQIEWLLEALTYSKSVWKIIASPQPLSAIVYHGNNGHDGIGNGIRGKPQNREIELARLLRGIQERKIKNCVWVTADVHYAAAHRYEPERASTPHFDGFWEFLAGPLNAGTFGPNRLDSTFGPKVEFVSLPKGVRQGASPLDGHQFFGSGSVDPTTGALTISLHNSVGKALWSTVIPPEFS